jgi:hypothetical protein
MRSNAIATWKSWFSATEILQETVYLRINIVPSRNHSHKLVLLMFMLVELKVTRLVGGDKLIVHRRFAFEAEALSGLREFKSISTLVAIVHYIDLNDSETRVKMKIK